MIIRQEKAVRLWNRRYFWVAIAGLAVSVLALVLLTRKPAPAPDTIYCDMESVVEEGGTKYFLGSSGAKLRDGQNQSNTVSRSGKFSCVVIKGREFALTTEYEVGGADEFVVSGWRFSPTNNGNIIGDGNWGYYGTATPTGQKDINGWEEFQLKFRVPDHIRDGKLKIYVWNAKEDAVYFDDLSIKRINKIPHPPKPVFQASDSIPVVNLVINDKDMDKLGKIREQALKKGILAANTDAWVDGRIEEGKGQWRGKVRLKGDWTDHLQGDKWSYRMTLDPGQSWRRMITFSFQSPHTRSYLDEWVFHQWMEAEDVLCPRYDFVQLKVNGVSKGVYAYEEHFEKQIVEYKQRREGPIMKFNEEGFWEIVERSLDEGGWFDNRVPYVEGSSADAFVMKRTLKDSTLRGNFLTAITLMEDYKNNRKPVEEIFDVDKLAKYYALIDVAQAFHGLVWHNQRLYYNPVISRMEPIGFDGYTQDGPLKWLERPFMGHGRNLRYVNNTYKEQMFSRFFNEPRFVARYVRYLRKFTDPQYIHALFEGLEKELLVREQWIKKEWMAYTYKRSMIYEEARLLRQTINPLKLTSAKAHLQGKRGNSTVYQVFNYHCLPIRLLGVGKKDAKMDAPFDTDVTLNSYVSEYPAETAELTAPIEGKVIFFEVPGIDSIFTADILPWPVPGLITTEQELFRNIHLESNDIYTVDSARKEIVFHAGQHKSAKDILIPQGWLVKFNAGVDLDLVQKAKFISKSPVVINGSAEKPVLVHSSDHSANGFTVLQAEGKCEWRHAVFEDMNTLNYKGWKLTGAVTLYECEVYFEQCRFVSNHCEDALNTIRCVFDFNNSYVGNTYGDGFDADFCKGLVRDGHFYDTGNDGMDFSGSFITIESAEIDNAGDKGISLGEECTILIKNATVRNSVIGFAAKDLTVVTVENVTLIGNETAIAGYQKKPEYGPSKIIVKKSKLEGNKTPYLLQTGSELHIDGKVIKGKL